MKSLKFLGLSKYSISHQGKVYSHYSKRFLKEIDASDGYYKINLVNDSGVTEYWRVGRLVAHAYCEGYEEGLVVNHKDGDKKNNEPSNLEWVTISENAIHAVNNKLQTHAGKYQVCEIDTVHEVCRMLEQGYRKKDIADMLDVSIRFVTEINNKTKWSSISDEYSINYIKRDDRLSPEKVLSICKDLESGLNIAQTATNNGASTSSVHRIRRRQSYSDISKNFKF